MPCLIGGGAVDHVDQVLQVADGHAVARCHAGIGVGPVIVVAHIDAGQRNESISTTPRW